MKYQICLMLCIERVPKLSQVIAKSQLFSIKYISVDLMKAGNLPGIEERFSTLSMD